MGSFVFQWAHPASEVYVTGTFDSWSKSQKLQRVGQRFEASVHLPDATRKYYYKFVVDGNWVTDHTAPRERDEDGHENNVLTPERIIRDAPSFPAIMSTVTPDSTTAILAGGVPLDKKGDNSEELPGTFPETPALDLNKQLGNKGETSEEELPGTFPETPAADLNKQFSVNPLPAADGAVNPVHLAPGEKVPESIAAKDINRNVKLDKESYERADELPGGASLPGLLSGAGLTTFSSASPDSTTAALAANAPLEPKVPAIVKDSQEVAHVAAEASAYPEEVREKAAVEAELKDKVAEAPVTSADGKSEHTTRLGEAAASVTSAVAAAGAAVGSAALGAAVYAKDTVVEKAPVVGSAVADAAIVTKDTIVAKAPGVGNVLAGATITAKDTVADKAPVVGSAVADAAVTTKDTIAEKAPVVGNTVADAAVSAKDTVAEKGSVLGSSIADAAISTKNVVAEKGSVLGSSIADTATSTTNVVAEKGQAVGSSIADTAISTKNVVAEKSQAVGSSIADTAISTKNVVAEKGQAVGNAVTDATVSAKHSVVQTSDAATRYVSGTETTNQTTTLQHVSPEVPYEVKESIKASGRSAEAASNTEAVEDKKKMESELLSEVKPATAVGDEKHTERKPLPIGKSSPELAPGTALGPKDTAAQTAPTVTTGVSGPVPTAESSQPRIESAPLAVDNSQPRVVSSLPVLENTQHTNVTTHTAVESIQPVAESSQSPSDASQTPGKTPDSIKKKNRLSMLFGKIKGKLQK